MNSDSNFYIVDNIYSDSDDFMHPPHSQEKKLYVGHQVITVYVAFSFAIAKSKKVDNFTRQKPFKLNVEGR